MTYPTGGELVLTNAQLRQAARIYTELTPDEIDALLAGIKHVRAMGQGAISLKIYRGHLRFIEVTVTNDLRE